jgi:hypothetical protein
MHHSEIYFIIVYIVSIDHHCYRNFGLLLRVNQRELSTIATLRLFVIFAQHSQLRLSRRDRSPTSGHVISLHNQQSD